MLSVQDAQPSMGLLTYDDACVVGVRLSIYHILVAEYLHQPVEELAFLFLSSGKKKFGVRDRCKK